MQGNPIPLSFKNLELREWPYDPQTGWGMIPTTPAPKAVFDATNSSMSLEDTNGYLNGRSSNSLANYPNQVSPTGGREWRIRHAAKSSAYGDNNREINYDILSPTLENYHHVVFHQPANFYHRKCVAINGDLLAVADWITGDTVTTSEGNTAKFFGTETATEDGDVIIFEDYTGQFSVNWGNGKVVTNDRTGGTVTSTDSHLVAANNKLFHEWVGRSGTNDGYPNGSLKIEFDAAGGGNSKIKPSRSAGTKDVTDPAADFGPSNLGGNEAVGFDDNVLIWDTADNGFDVEFVIGRKRSTGPTTNDAEMHLWKKSSRSGSPLATWTLIWSKTGIDAYADTDTGTPNLATVGYMLGASNSGYTDETDFGLKYWGYWTQKPTFLTEAGV